MSMPAWTWTLLGSVILLWQPATHAEEPGQQQWGHLRGQILFKGKVPQRKNVELNKDIEFCQKDHPLEEEIVVNPKNRGLANVVIWFDERKNPAEVPIHKDYDKTAKDKVLLDNAACRFEPHVCVMRTSQTLVVGNKDAIPHQATGFMFKNDPFNVSVPAKGEITKELTMSESLPSKVTCPIHAWMRGWLMVKDHPYVAVTDADGNFEMKNLPAGEWVFRVWHEEAGYLDALIVNNEPANWEKGRVTLTIKPGVNNLGTLEIEASEFAD